MPISITSLDYSFSINLDICATVNAQRYVKSSTLEIIDLSCWSMSDKLPKIYYSPQGYCSGIAAVKKLATNSKVAHTWLKRQV